MSENAKGWKEGMARYLAWVKAQHSTMRLLGQPRPVPLEGIFTDVEVLDRLSASRWVELVKLREHYAGGERHPTGKRENGMVVVAREPRLFILGKPGAGKTTFLRYVALQAATRKPLTQVPIFVSLKEVADSGRDVLSFIVEQFSYADLTDTEGFVKKLLKTGRALVLLDGLDEIQGVSFHQHNTLRQLKKLITLFPENQYLITCRLAATEYQFERFTYIEMADFTDAQIERFVGKWFASEPTRGTLFLEELAKPEYRGFRELAQVPLLLTLLCLAFDETLSFPQRRVEVYNEAVEALLRKWDVSRNIRRDEMYRHLSPDRKRQLLARLAFDTFERGHYFIPQAELEAKIVEWLRYLPSTKADEELDGRTILKAIEAQHGIFVERAQKIYSFAHLSFQEYFTAKYIVELGDVTLRFLTFKATEMRWREIFLLVASLLPKANDFFEFFLEANDLLLADEQELIEILTWADDKANQVISDYKAEAARSYYLHLELERPAARTLAYSLDSKLTRTLALTHQLALDYVLDRIHDLAQGLARDIARAHARELGYELDPTLIIAQTLARDLARAQADAFEIERLILRATRLSEELELFECQAALQTLSIPSPDASQNEWRGFVQVLQNIMLTHRKLGHAWEFTEEQMTRLTDYLTATQLLVDCLAVAIVRDRDGIKARLLRPPTPTTKPPVHH